MKFSEMLMAALAAAAVLTVRGEGIPTLPFRTMPPPTSPDPPTSPPSPPSLTVPPKATAPLTALPEDAPILTAPPEDAPILTAIPEDAPILTAPPEDAPILTANPKLAPPLASRPKAAHSWTTPTPKTPAVTCTSPTDQCISCFRKGSCAAAGAPLMQRDRCINGETCTEMSGVAVCRPAAETECGCPAGSIRGCDVFDKQQPIFCLPNIGVFPGTKCAAGEECSAGQCVPRNMSGICSHNEKAFILSTPQCTEAVFCSARQHFPIKCEAGQYFQVESGCCAAFPPDPCAGCTSKKCPIITDCRKYAVCIDGWQIDEETCTQKFFNPISGFCDADSAMAPCSVYTNCSFDTIPTKAAQISIFKPSTCEASNFGMQYPHETDCKKYYVCTLTTSSEYGYVEEMCHGTSVFNPEFNYCDWPSNVPSCSQTPSTTTTTTTTPTTTTSTTTTTTIPTTTTTTTPTITRPTPTIGLAGLVAGLATKPATCTAANVHERYPHETDCGKFYICSRIFNTRYAYVVITCFRGRVYNPILKYCDLPSNVPGCSLLSTRMTSATMKLRLKNTPTATLPICSPANAEQRYPHENDCRKYYKCRLITRFGYMYVESTCPFGYVYNPSIQECDDPSNVPDC